MGLDLHGLTPYFDTIVGFEDSERHKPLPDPALLAAERLGWRPTRRLSPMWATRPSTWPARVAAGVRPIGVPWGAAPVADLRAAGADPVLQPGTT